VGAAAAALISGAAAAVSAQDWSIGVGGVFSSNLGGGFKSESFRNDDKTWHISKLTNPYMGGGVDVFFAAKYAEAHVALVLAEHEWKPVSIRKNSAGEVLEKKPDTTFGLTAISVNIGTWFKYPIRLSESVSLSPMMGIDYELCGTIESISIGGKPVTSGYILKIDANNLSRTWFKAGASADIGLSERIFLHPVALYGVGWKNSIERRAAEEFKADKAGKSTVVLSHGPTASIGVGYRFGLD